MRWLLSLEPRGTAATQSSEVTAGAGPGVGVLPSPVFSLRRLDCGVLRAQSSSEPAAAIAAAAACKNA